jgi:hypothetical protein
MFNRLCRYRIGVYDNEVEAAHVYDTHALKFHGARALLNFPRDSKRFSGGNGAGVPSSDERRDANEFGNGRRSTVGYYTCLAVYV